MKHKGKKRELSLRLSKNSLKFLFRLSVVYLLFLGILNIAFVILRPEIERSLKKALDAEEVSLGYVSNVPFIFVNFSKLSIKINEELKFEMEDVYLRYRIWHLFTRNWELVPASFSINKTAVEFHSYVLNEYISHMKQKYPARPKKQSSFSFDPSMMVLDVKIRNTALTVRSMTHYRVDLTINNARADLENGSASWRADLNLQAKWSNQVDILALDSKGSGIISNFQEPSGFFTIGLNHLNLGGLPLIAQKNTEFLNLNFSMDQGVLSFNAVSKDSRGSKTPASEAVSLEGDQKHFTLKINKPFEIQYNDFEEYQALDYVFKRGRYNLSLNLENSPDWNARFQITSIDHPGYGAEIGFHPKGGGSYAIPVDIKTHFFGNLRADLTMDNRKGLLPLPSGVLDLENIRFLLPGLVFSGHAVAKALPGRNNLDITVLDILMNGGRIGNARVDLGVYNGKHLIIKPLAFSNDVEVFVDVDKKVDVLLKAKSLDGDFLAKNTYLTVFGLHTSTYNGDVRITKASRLAPVLVDGAVTGILDGERQIEVEMQYTNDRILVPRLYFIGQKLLIQGSVDIIGSHTNTKVTVQADARLGAGPEVRSLAGDEKAIPVQAFVLLEKDKTTVKGLVDDKVPFLADALGSNVDLVLEFRKYPLQKLMVSGNISGDLRFGFSSKGWTRFNFDNGLWEISDRVVTLDFASSGEEGYLPLERFKVGLDNEILDGKGYIDVSKGIGGAVRFDQGGSLQFIVGEYTWKAAVDLREYRIDELFAMPFMGPLRNLQNPSTETVYADMRVKINGQLNDPDIEGSFNLIGDAFDKIEAVQTGGKKGRRSKNADKIENPSFQIAAQKFTKTGGELLLQNLRLRHPNYNVDGNVRFAQNGSGAFDADLTGALAVLGNAVKTGLKLSIKKNPESGLLEYSIPNLYVLSKTSMQMSGKILQQGARLVFLSDNPKYGISGYYDYNKIGNQWNILFQSDALKLNSEGRSTANYMYGYIDGTAILKKLNMNKPIRKIDGIAEIHLKAEGSPNNPVINGTVVFNDVSLTTTGLRNKLRMPLRNEILVRNNRIIIPDFSIVAGSGNIFGLDGWVNIQDKSIDELNIALYSKSGQGNEPASLNWRMNIPYISVNGQTAIEHFTVSGGAGNINISSKILAKNLNMNLELQDVVGGTGTAAPVNEMATALFSALNFDIDVTLGNSARFLNQLFDFRFEPNQNIKVQGNIGENTLAVQGEIPIQSGTINYLGKDLKIDKGNLAFTGDPGDPYPMVNVSTSTTEKESQGEQVTVNVDFGGKLPNIELASLRSTPPRSREEIYGLLGFGGSTVATRDGTNSMISTSQEAIASSVGIAENALFIAPLTQRLRRTFAFFDSFQVKTDVLGNLTRAFSLGNTVSGLALLNGSEVEIGKNIPNLNGLQVRFNMRFESPMNNVVGDYLQQRYKIGLLYDYRTPSLWQLSLGISGRVTVDPPASALQAGAATPGTTTTVEALLEASIKKSFGYQKAKIPPRRPPAREPIFE